jgi:hypothetical protein
MALFGSSAPAAAAPANSSEDVQQTKANLVAQLQQEMAMANAKKLISVRSHSISFLSPIFFFFLSVRLMIESRALANFNTESQPELLRELHHSPRLLIVRQ